MWINYSVIKCIKNKAIKYTLKYSNKMHSKVNKCQLQNHFLILTLGNINCS